MLDKGKTVEFFLLKYHIASFCSESFIWHPQAGQITLKLFKGLWKVLEAGLVYI